jgi:hypothetical protein
MMVDKMEGKTPGPTRGLPVLSIPSDVNKKNRNSREVIALTISSSMNIVLKPHVI